MPSPALLLLADGRFPAGGHVHSAGIEAAVADGRVTSVDELRAFLVGRLHTTGLSDAALAARVVLGDGRPAEIDRLDAEAAARLPVPVLRAASRRLGRQLLRVAARCWPAPVLDVVVAPAPATTERARPGCETGEAGEADPGGKAGEVPEICVRRSDASRIGVEADEARPGGKAGEADEADPGGDARPGAEVGAVGKAGEVGAAGELHHPVALGLVAVAAGLTAGDAAALAIHHVLSTPAQAAVRLLGLDPFAVVALLAELAPAAERVAADAVAAALGPLDDLPAGSGPLVELAALDHERWPIRMFAT